jgi:hypothetical protein
MQEDSDSTAYQAQYEAALMQRMPGEQWVTLDSVGHAQRYLDSLTQEPVRIIREPYPNPLGLFARVRYPDRIPELKLFVPLINNP